RATDHERMRRVAASWCESGNWPAGGGRPQRVPCRVRRGGALGTASAPHPAAVSRRLGADRGGRRRRAGAHRTGRQRRTARARPALPDLLSSVAWWGAGGGRRRLFGAAGAGRPGRAWRGWARDADRRRGDGPMGGERPARRTRQDGVVRVPVTREAGARYRLRPPAAGVRRPTSPALPVAAHRPVQQADRGLRLFEEALLVTEARGEDGGRGRHPAVGRDGGLGGGAEGRAAVVPDTALAALGRAPGEAEPVAGPAVGGVVGRRDGGAHLLQLLR